jgi:hypothetical protein
MPGDDDLCGLFLRSGFRGFCWGILRKVGARRGDLGGETWCYVWWLWSISGHILVGEKYARV